MKRAALGALLGASALVAAAGGCRAVVGAGDDVTDVVEEMCACDELRFLGTPDACAATIGDRLTNARAEVRSQWMQKYAAECTACPTARACYYTIPTCSQVACAVSEECCGFEAGVTCDPATHECKAP